MLPVDPGQDTTFGDSIGTAVSLGAHNTYNLTIIQPGYATHPWYGDNPDDASTKQETFLLDILTWIKAHLATTGTEPVYLIGFQVPVLAVRVCNCGILLCSRRQHRGTHRSR